MAPARAYFGQKHKYLFYVKTERVLNIGSFVSRLVSCLISRVVHGYMFIVKEIR